MLSGFRFAMNYSRVMRLRQTFGRMLQVAQQLSQFRVFAMNLFAESNALDKLHGDVS
jgi:hypothetical protein